MALLTARALIHFRTATGILLSKTYFVRTFPRYKNFDLIALRIQGTFDGEELDGDADDTTYTCGDCDLVKKLTSAFLKDIVFERCNAFSCSNCGLRNNTLIDFLVYW